MKNVINKKSNAHKFLLIRKCNRKSIIILKHADKNTESTYKIFLNVNTLEKIMKCESQESVSILYMN